MGMTTRFGPTVTVDTVMIGFGPHPRGCDQLVCAPPFAAVVTRSR